MKSKLPLLILPLLLAAPISASAGTINLNQTSNLADEGIEPQASPATVFTDIPVMEGLQLDQDKVVKVLPEHVRPYVTLVGVVDVDDVYKFYQRTLPPLGWDAATARDYIKGSTLLHVNAVADGKLTTVTLTESGNK